MQASSSLSIESNDNRKSEPSHVLLEQSTAPHFADREELIRMIHLVSSGCQRHLAQSRHPLELEERIAHYLEVSAVCMDHVIATNCSSQQPLLKLSDCLNESQESWWISGEDVRLRPQFVEFSLMPKVLPSSSPIPFSVCKLHAVSIQIPPLPEGPMSVLEFRIDSYIGPSTKQQSALSAAARANGVRKGEDETTSETKASNWQAVTPSLFAASRSGWQRFEIHPPVDASRVRIVCLSNQSSAPDISVSYYPRLSLVGFYSIRFE